MKVAYVFDSFETLLTSPGWTRKKEADPRLKQLEQEWKAAGRPPDHPYLDEGERAIIGGEVITVAFPESRYVLEKLSRTGVPVVYSSNREEALRAMLTQADLIHCFPDLRFLIPTMSVGSLPKESPDAFSALDDYLESMDLIRVTYVDDSLDVVKAAAAAKSRKGLGIRSKAYHIDRKSGLSVPRKDGGIITISSLDQMAELRD